MAAIDVLGRIDELTGGTGGKHDQHYGSYVIDHTLPIEVFVDDRTGSPA